MSRFCLVSPYTYQESRDLQCSMQTPFTFSSCLSYFANPQVSHVLTSHRNQSQRRLRGRKRPTHGEQRSEKHRLVGGKRVSPQTMYMLVAAILPIYTHVYVRTRWIVETSPADVVAISCFHGSQIEYFLCVVNSSNDIRGGTDQGSEG